MSDRLLCSSRSIELIFILRILEVIRLFEK